VNQPPPATRLPRNFTLALVATTAVFLLLPGLDTWAYVHVRAEGVYARDWGRLLRVMGFAPTWVLIALGITLSRRGLRASRGHRAVRMPGLFLLASIAATGLVGELVKLVVRRGRPGPSEGLYELVPWTGSWSTGALGFPSTHAIVAFAGAFAMARLSPRSAPVWLALGAGCGVTRLLDGKHFLSDVVAAAALAGGLVAILWEAMVPDRLDPA
jgi:membrane-associated phospholipid phosphatase